MAIKGSTDFWEVEYNTHWATKETYPFLRTTFTKNQSIKINHICTQISFTIPYQKYLQHKGLLESKGENARWNRKRSYFKNHTELLALSCQQFATDKAVVFSERRSEGVISFFWRSVTLNQNVDIMEWQIPGMWIVTRTLVWNACFLSSY